MSKLIINEPPLVILPTLATIIGLNEAIFLQQLHYWICNGKGHLRDGRYWHYDSRTSWQKQFPFWSLSTIKRIVISLTGLKVVIKGNYNRSAMDKTNWYTIDYELLESLYVCPLGQIDPVFGRKKQNVESHTVKEDCFNHSTNGSDWHNEDTSLTQPLPKSSTKTYINHTYIDAVSDNQPPLCMNVFDDVGQPREPKGEVSFESKIIQDLKAKWKSWGIADQLVREWRGLTDEENLAKVTDYAEKNAKTNPGAYLSRLVKEWYITTSVDPVKPNQQPEKRFYSKAQNIAWYQSLSEEEKTEQFNLVLTKHAALSKHMELGIGGSIVGHLDKIFVDHWAFTMFMEILGRYDRKKSPP